MQQRLGSNPYRFGMIGSTDAHTGLATADDNNFFGKHAVVEPRPDRPNHISKEFNGVQRFGWHYLAGGYAAAWASENTREAIWDAFARREVYASTGPRIQVRLFGGWNFESRDASTPDLASLGYANGVPMGAELPARNVDVAPSFLLAAQKDPIGANLDRVQVVKGWVDRDGGLHERVYNVAWSEPKQRSIDADTGRLSPVGSSVELAPASWQNTIGSAELRTVWIDPDFDPESAAFYYLRVLEIPTPRWTSYDVTRLGSELPAEVPRAVQQRAYTSPIWYTPSKH